jgi:PHD/YefM family antitoxin component YafN of YafNO toxin-antitoxin module
MNETPEEITASELRLYMAKVLYEVNSKRRAYFVMRYKDRQRHAVLISFDEWERMRKLLEEQKKTG